MYYQIVSTTAITKVTHSYFESGHSMNEGDSMHASIEFAKKNKLIFCPEQYYFLARIARNKNPYNVYEMATEEFVDFEAMSKEKKINWKVNSDNERVNWRKIRVIKFDQITHPDTMLYRTDYDQPFKAVELLSKQKKVTPRQGLRKGIRSQDTTSNTAASSIPAFPKRYLEKPTISEAKYKDLKTLCESCVIPAPYHSFYQSLPVAGGQDEAEESDSE